MIIDSGVDFTRVMGAVNCPIENRLVLAWRSAWGNRHRPISVRGGKLVRVAIAGGFEPFVPNEEDVHVHDWTISIGADGELDPKTQIMTKDGDVITVEQTTVS